MALLSLVFCLGYAVGNTASQIYIHNGALVICAITALLNSLLLLVADVFFSEKSKVNSYLSFLPVCVFFLLWLFTRNGSAVSDYFLIILLFTNLLRFMRHKKHIKILSPNGDQTI
ncbi:MAG: hypothetical protein V4581_06045 [Bacteroidota bacterium]